jgi:hypothetical protein
MTEPLLICTDLDRTLIPNGPQPESIEARPLFRRLVERPEVCLAYVSGRDQGLLRQAIEAYSLPVPDWAIGDVGTTIYRVEGDDWRPWAAWSRTIAPDWNGRDRQALAEMLADIDVLEMQEPAKQNTFKLSYYAPSSTDGDALAERVRKRLEAEGIRAGVIWSIDEVNDIGLLDILPARATKVHAVRFLRERLGIPERRTVFAGDSGNDLPVLTSGLPSVVVANAREQIKRAARDALAARGLGERLYVARGGFLGMNGCYAAGILEGVAHFIPEVADWLVSESSEPRPPRP